MEDGPLLFEDKEEEVVCGVSAMVVSNLEFGKVVSLSWMRI